MLPWLQTSESVHVSLRVRVSRAGVWSGGVSGTVKCTSVESFLRWEASEGRVLFECKGGSKLITAIRNESQLVIDTGGHEFGDTMPLLQRKTIKLGGYFKLIFLYCK